MSDATNLSYAARLAAGAFERGAANAAACQTLLVSLYDNQDALGLALPEPVERVLAAKHRTNGQVRQVLARHRKDLVAALREIAETGDGREEDALARNLRWLARDLGLDRSDRLILEAAFRYLESYVFEDIVDALTIAQRGVPRKLAFLLGLGRKEIESRLGPNAALADSGLVTVNLSGRYLVSADGGNGDCLVIHYLARRHLGSNFDRPEALRDALFGTALRAGLALGDFGHLGQDADFARRVLTGAASHGEEGVNILLYGPPGTGKTELCKTLAAESGLTLFAAGESGRHGGELRREDRLRNLCLLQRLAARRARTVLLFDEMEDLQPGNYGPFGGSATRSKVFLNRLLETNPVPVLWTANDIARFDPAMLRRMTLVIEMKTPGAGARRRLWRQLAERSGVTGNDGELGRLAEDLDVAPALAANALRAAELGGGGLGEAERAARALIKAVKGGCALPPARAREAAFDPRLARADLDLRDLTERVAAPGAPRAFSLCLAGPPGTGKSAYARHLAEAMGLRVMKKRVSDLISKWLGESEKAIARAFEEAREEKAVLIFDEADALLTERAGALRSWEVSQVAEMLTWMEVHPLPFCCTTNLMERLDRASLRRFTFKVTFRALAREQVALAFELFFGLEAPPHVLALDNLTPGDFATVRNKARILGRDGDAVALAAMLGEEAAAKPGHRPPIGFAAG